MAFYFYFYHIYYLYLSNCSTSPSTGSTACTTSYSSTPSSTWTSTVPPRHSPLHLNKDHQYAALGHLQGSTCSEYLCLCNELKTSTIVFNCRYPQYKALVWAQVNRLQISLYEKTSVIVCSDKHHEYAACPLTSDCYLHISVYLRKSLTACFAIPFLTITLA